MVAIKYLSIVWAESYVSESHEDYVKLDKIITKIIIVKHIYFGMVK